MTHRNRILLVCTTLAASIVFAGCKPAATPTNTVFVDMTSPSPVAVVNGVPATEKLKANYEFTATQSGQLAEDLIVAGAKIETKDFGNAGKFVTSINGLAGNNEYYWAFYLNGKYAEAGISQTKLSKGDVIKFVYEAVTTTK